MQRKPRKPNPIKLLPGLLDLLVLQALGNRRLRTRAIARLIFEITNETFEVGTASLIPALKRLREAECVYREEIVKGNVVFYRLTRSGRLRLKAARRRWDRIREGVDAACRHALGEEGDPDFCKRVPTRSPRRVAYGDFDSLPD
jgi:DNA-binding PadR family transcriptional regulator